MDCYQNSVQCCICSQTECIRDTLIPRKCLKTNAFSAHRICNKCWWEPETGFAVEERNHDCHGCINGLPLNKNKDNGVVIDLTSDE
jgi:hypothetical protein